MASRLPPLQSNWSNVGRVAENQVMESPSRGANSRMLIERASELKNAIVSHMMEESGYGAWPDRQLRGLLQEHLHTVTSALKRLGHEIESLESQLSGRDQASAMSNNLMRSLEVQQATSVNDLRSRVARCDANISVLSGDMRKMFDSLSTLTLQMQTVMGHQTRTENLLEEKISKLGESSEEHRSKHSARLTSSEEKFQQALATLDARLQSLIDETQRTVESIRTEGLSSQAKLEREMTMSMDMSQHKRDKKVDEVEESLQKKIASLERRQEKLETELREAKSESKAGLREVQRTSESTLQNELLRVERRLRAVVEEAQGEISGGLEALKESLTSLRAVLEGKQVLLAEELRAEMARMKKLVVVT
ncbi:protein FAM81A-like [Diadema setosum]|uniref:protein FAM81A-like n=1 Tax=Diadema setosum TaxID=31175 RepID=UPI003B3B6260